MPSFAPANSPIVNLPALPPLTADQPIHYNPQVIFGMGAASATNQTVMGGSLFVNNVSIGQINNVTYQYQQNALGSPYPFTVTPIYNYPAYNYYQTTSANITYNYQWPSTTIYNFDANGTISQQTYAYAETEEQRTTREAATLALEIKRTAADKKAEELLMMILNDKQKKQYAEFGFFETEINDKIYRIRKGRSGNVRMLKDGKEKEQFCAHPNDAYVMPEHDTMIAQYLMLKTDEKAFLSKANRTVLY